MRLWTLLLSVALGIVAITAQSISTDGITDLVQRRLPDHVDDFEFQLSGNATISVFNITSAINDEYIISSTLNNKILIEGNSLIALASGLHHYLTDIANVDIFWFIGSRLDQAPTELPILDTPITGSSVVPWRYHFNTVTFSYTTAFWSWEDWELELDWLALRGVNLPLAWVGYEKILLDVYRGIGLTDDQIIPFFSGPAFQAWNRFGNIQGSWGGELPIEWINSQFELQKNITRRMIELGMTPVLPAFTGFVPRAIADVLPNLTVVISSRWGGFPVEYTNVTFLEPTDPAFTVFQKSFIYKQTAALGNITHIYTLDQFNENNPESGDLDYLRSVSSNTWKSLKAADPNSIWLMQGWLFFANSDFWDESRIQAYLSGVEENGDMLILDLFSESKPQWQRTNSYYGKSWIWCQLHDYGGSMGLYGQIENITFNPIEALADSRSLIGFGLTMEGQEGNEIVYDLLLDQAWSGSPIDTETYFHNWVTRRYAGTGHTPEGLYSGWEMLRTTVYNNTNLASGSAVTRSILELSPDINGLVGRTNPFGGTTVNYDPSVLVSAWKIMFNASNNTGNPALWNNPSYQYDMTDITRQVMANSFLDIYTELMSTYNSSAYTNASLTSIGQNLTTLLNKLDTVLSTNPAFTLSTYVNAARSRATNLGSTIADFYEYQARNQITLWGPNGEISDYASKSWGGLVKGYYQPRWEIFLNYIGEVKVSEYSVTELRQRLRTFEEAWEVQPFHKTGVAGAKIEQSLKEILEGLVI